MRPYRAWKGALELTIRDVPLNVSVEFYACVKKQRNESFKTLTPGGQPVRSVYLDENDQQIERADCQRGVEVGKGEYVVMTDDALAKIDEGVKTEVIEAEQYVSLDSVPLAFAIDRYAVRPQEEVAGSSDAVNIVWNGLRANNLGWVAQVSLRGGHDAILVLYGDDGGLWAALLPFEEELYPAPTFAFRENKKAAALFGEHVEQEHEVEVFNLSAWKSEYRARRQGAIDAVVAGQPVKVASPPKAKKPEVDLLAALQATADSKKSSKKKAA